MQFANSTGAAGSSPTSISEEIAVRSQSIDYYAIGNMYLPNPDPVLKSQGKDIQVYTDLLIDDRVGGGLINRGAAAKGLVCSIERGTSTTRQFKAIKDIFDTLKINNIIETILKARAYGYSPIEVIYGVNRDGLTVPLDLIGKPQRWFVFSPLNELRFRSRDHLMDGEELPPRKFLCPTNEASYENPYGLGLLSRCFWPVAFKKGGWRFWIQFSEKFGQLWPIGKLPRTAGKEQQQEMLDTLVSMVQDGAAVIPDDGSISSFESGTKTATADLYRGIIAEANSAISTVWHGHAAAGESVGGELGGGKGVAIFVRDDLRDDDANLITSTLQQVVNWMCEINWGSSVDSPIVELKPKQKIDTTQAERDKSLTESMQRSGLKLTRSYYEKTYSLDSKDIEEAPAETVTPLNPPLGKGGGLKALPLIKGSGEGLASQQFSEPTPPDSADIIAQNLDSVASSAIDNWLTLLKKKVDQSGNLIDLRTDLLGTAGLAIAPLARVIGDALLLSHLAGRGEIIDEITASINFAESALVSALNLPFQEAIAFFRNKVNIPTERWNDLFLDQHSQGFMIAGAMKGELISDIRAAVDQAISAGITLADFRKQWDQIVERHGWQYNGGRNWRTRIVYETNTRQAYNAGRWQQATDPDVLKTRPYLIYRHGDSVHPRLLHLSWNGTCLPADDPWWATHTPQNGWGCKCKIFSGGERDIERMGSKARLKAPDDGAYDWTDKQGRTFNIPNGIDRGFQYNPGTAATKSKDILQERINQLPPDIAKQINVEIAQSVKQ